MSDDKKTLKDLVNISSEIEQALILSDGEITPDIEAMLMITDIQLPAKVDGYCMLLDRLDSVADYYRDKAETFQKLMRGTDKFRDFLKERVKESMTQLKVSELPGNDFKFRLQNSKPTVVIEDKEQVPAGYAKIEQVITHDKKKIGDDLKMGLSVPGAKLVEDTHVRQYANKRK